MRGEVLGLPEGYQGLFIVADRNYSGGGCRLLDVEINPTSTRYGCNFESIWVFVWHEQDGAEGFCAKFSFDLLPCHIIPDNSDILDVAHSRKGIATSVYEFLGSYFRLRLVPAESQSNDALALWESFRRDGRSFLGDRCGGPC